ncbi:hypothetical protein Nmel_010274, partial [Mimus melanotis]
RGAGRCRFSRRGVNTARTPRKVSDSSVLDAAEGAFQKMIYRFVPHSSRDFTQMLTGDTSWNISTRPEVKGDSQ